ncbi:MAG: glycosyltransferase [Candidatus Gastranaerophilales bacterium]|nr:glycosyltransferase [Candidatus Gastranaerophilales bacterium]
MQTNEIKVINKGDYVLTNYRTNYRRGVLWLGQTCNQRCTFCYFANSIETKDQPEHAFASFDKAKEMCRTLRETYNNNSVDIQGGEPTIYPHIYELIKYCNEIGLKPTLITNALVLDDIEKCKKYKEAGIFDFLISVHNLGTIHDEIVGVPGAHKRQMKALDNLVKVGIPFRFNTVLTNEVLPNLQKIVELAVEKGARACNFICFNMSPDQKERRTKDNVTLCSKIKETLPDVLDYLDKNEIEVNIRYLPFCMFEPRHRKFVQDTKQTIYDLHEWEYAGRLWTQDKFQREANAPLSKPVNMFDFLLKKRKDRHHKIKEFFEKNPDKLVINPPINEMTDFQKDMDQEIGDYKPLFYKDSMGASDNLSIYDYAYSEVREITTIEHRYKKTDKCSKCDLNSICDGFQKDYIELWGDDDAIPETSIGKMIFDPIYYMKDQMKIVEKEEYDWALAPARKEKQLLKLPLVSLVVTNYNYSEFIEDCVKGILNQTYQNLECIIVDDCSTDDSVAKIEKFIKNNQKSDISFRLIKQDKNQGQLAGFIKGIKQAKGVFLGFVDADDIILPEFVNTHIQVHFKTNVAMSVTQQVEFDENNEIHSLFSLASPQIQKQGEASLKPQKFEDLENMVKSQKFFEEEINYKVISVDTHKFGGWHWGPTSNVIFRKNVLDFFVFADNFAHWKHCADNLLFNFAHLLGGSCIIYTPLTAYRRHSSKGFSNRAITGIVRFFTQKSKDKMKVDREVLIKDMLSIFVNGKEEFLNFMDKNAFQNLVKGVVVGTSKEELAKNVELLKQLLNKDEIEKYLN